MRVAGARSRIERRAAREPEAEQACDLVERLAGGVIEGLAEHHMPEQFGDVDEHRVTARDDQGDVRRIGRTVLQEVRPVVPFQVVDADQRRAGRERERLGGSHPHEERPDQSGTDRHGDAVHVIEVASGPLERIREERVERLDVRARRHLRDHPPEPLMEMLLAGDQVGADPEAVLEHRDGCLVARRFDPERDHAGRIPSGNDATIASRRRPYAASRMSSVHMIRASSWSSA